MDKGKNFNHPAKGSTIKAEPVKNIDDIKAIEKLLSHNPRDLALFSLGINTCLKVCDLLKIRVKQVTDIEPSGQIELTKSKPENRIKFTLNTTCVNAVKNLVKTENSDHNNYLFKGRDGSLSIHAVNNLVKKWCAGINLKGNYGSQTLRKTFGYQQLIHFNAGLPDLMVLFNHSSRRQTLEYLCIGPKELNNIGGYIVQAEKEPVIGKLKQRLATSEKREARLKQVIMELKDSEEKFKTFFENANDQIVYTDLEGRVIEVNDSATRDIFGQTRKEALGKHIAELGIFTDETLEDIYEKSKVTAMDNQPPRVELKAFHRNGSAIYIDVNSKLMQKNGKTKGIISIVRDITDRKKVEFALQESREMARALLNATTDSVMLLDTEGIILDLNASYAEKFEKKIDETIGLCLWDLLPPEVAEKNRIKFSSVLKSGESIRFEEKYKDIWFDHVVYPVHDINQKVSSFAVFTRDITMRKQAEESLLNHRDQLEKLVKERTSNLEDANTALKVLLKRREEDRVELEEKMVVNVKELVLPFLEELKMSRLDERQKAFADIIESNLNDITSPFVHGLSTKYYSFSPTEIRIANIIKQGKTTKEIAAILKMSPRTVDNHRFNIRKKLGISNKKANLTTHLLSID